LYSLSIVIVRAETYERWAIYLLLNFILKQHFRHQRLGCRSRIRVMEAQVGAGMFNKESYKKHADWYNKHFPDKADKYNFYQSYRSSNRGTIAIWLQDCFFSCLTPLITDKRHNWLTVGDAYGFDARHLIEKGMNACATDLNQDFLEVANEIGVVNNYAVQNAERLTYSDNAFDYILCKESYHHFPRPYAALYEMVRVAGKGVVIIEPHDPIAKMPLLLGLMNLTRRWSSIQHQIWKNRFSFEPVGNFVYKVSEREFEKFAAGLNLPAVAFKFINPNFYHKDNELKMASMLKLSFFILRTKKAILDVLTKLHIIPGQFLSAIIFKELPTEAVTTKLEKDGYKIVLIPKNPFI
jgi:ubiquinone/menaquinone biosynthesis C-methylase UbiE